jgi:recombination protein RecT
MTTIAQQQPNKPASLKGLLAQDNIKKRFEEMLGQKAPGFISSIMNVVNNNKLLQNADPNTVIMAAAQAATLDLPINQNLGLAWIVPYKGQAQFQMGWRGFVQLALRTGLYKTINVCVITANEFKSWDKIAEKLELTGLEEGGDIVGFAGHFELTSGFKKTVYWNVKKVSDHARKYSKSVDNGPWKTHFAEMATKTVLKNMLSQYGILSIEMRSALENDQAVIIDEENRTYPDNPDSEFTSHEEVATEQTEAPAVSNSIPSGNDL